MKYLLRIVFCFLAGISPCLWAAPVEHFSCENLASDTEINLCNQFKFSLGDDVEIEILPDNKISDWQLKFSNNDERSPEDDKPRITLQKRNLSDKTMMVLLLPREETGSGGSGDIMDISPGASEDISPWIIIVPSLGFILHMGGWVATAIDIYESHFYGTPDDRSDSCSVIRVISYILTGFLAHIPHLIVRRWNIM